MSARTGPARPLVILGMHRSGTSLLARMLQDHGLFLGDRLQPDHAESVFFQELNEYVLGEGATSWDRADGADRLLRQPEMCDYLVDYLGRSVDGPRCVSFLGLRRWLGTRSLHRLADPWGWKDPRTTILFPLWERVFPACRVVHVLRHGTDVARSLQARTRRGIGEYTADYRQKARRYRYVGRRRTYPASLLMTDLDAGVELWHAYATAGSAAVARLGERAFELRYEDLLADPDPVMRDLLDFCELPTGDRTTWRDGVEPSRAYAHRSDPELRDVSTRHRDLLASFGYS